MFIVVIVLVSLLAVAIVSYHKFCRSRNKKFRLSVALFPITVFSFLIGQILFMDYLNILAKNASIMIMPLKISFLSQLIIPNDALSPEYYPLYMTIFLYLALISFLGVLILFIIENLRDERLKRE